MVTMYIMELLTNKYLVHNNWCFHSHLKRHCSCCFV